MFSAYLEALLLAHQDVLNALVQLLRTGLRVGDLVSPAHLLPQALLEIRLGPLILLNLPAQVLAGHVDLGLHALVAGARGLLDFLEQVAEIAETNVDLILDVVQSLTRGLVVSSGARVQQSVLGGRELRLSLGSQVMNPVVDLLAFVQDRGRSGGLRLSAHWGHF